MPRARRLSAPASLVATALLCGVLTALLVAAALAQPWQTRIQMGQHDHFYLRDFHTREYSAYDDITFRWSEPEAGLMFVGAGALAPLAMRMHGGEQGTALHLDIGTQAGSDGQHFTPVVLRPGWQRVVLLPRPQRWSGDVRLTIEAPTQVSAIDSRSRGVVLHRIDLTGRAGVFPPAPAVFAGLSSALVVALVSWCSTAMLPVRWSMLPGVVAGIAAGAGMVVALLHDGGSWRLHATHYSARLVLVLLVGALLALLTDRVLAWCQFCGMRPQMRRLLAAVALLAFVLRFGSMAYPLTTTTDVKFHVGRAWMVRSGKFLDLFLPNPKLTPIQWDTDITIPRSPFYYLLTVPATYVPGADGPLLASKVFGGAVETAAVLLVATMTLVAGGSQRAAVLAAVLAALLPFGLRIAVSWGIFPTLLAQCLAFLVGLVWLRLRPRLHKRRAQVVLTLALILAFIAYPTAVLFLGTTWVVLLLLLALRRDPATLPTLRAGAVAAVAVTLLYYGWHLPSLARQTIPVVLDAFAGSGSLNSTQQPRPGGMAALVLPLWSHYGPHIVTLAGGGALLLTTRPARSAARDTHTWLLAWCAAYPPFAFATLSVPLLEKHTAYLLPAVAVFGGMFLGRIIQRRAGGVVGVALLAFVLWQALVMLFDIIVHNLR